MNLNLPKTLGDLKRMTNANELYALREACYEQMTACVPGDAYKRWADRYDLVQSQLEDVLLNERRTKGDLTGWMALQPRFVNKWRK